MVVLSDIFFVGNGVESPTLTTICIELNSPFCSFSFCHSGNSE